MAKRIGIKTDKVKTRALLLEGLLCGFAGSFFWIVIENAVVTTGLNSYEFLAIAGACLGGISLLGGRGKRQQQSRGRQEPKTEILHLAT